MFAARRRGVKHFAVRREIETPRVARTGGDLFERRTVRFETQDARSNTAEIFSS